MTTRAPHTRSRSLSLPFLLVLALVADGATAATFNVTRRDDPPPGVCMPSDCSVREAIEAADATPGTDVVKLSLPSPTPRSCHFLTRGQLEVGDHVEIEGIGSVPPCIGTSTEDRIVLLQPGRSLTVRNLMLYGGDVDGSGGAIDANGSLIVLEDVLFWRNRASGNGGALRALNSVVDMSSTSFEDNQAGSSGGAIFGSGGFTFDGGTFSGNQAANNGGAVSLQAVTSQSTWNAVTATQNAAGDSGGAFFFNGGVHGLQDAVVLDNDSGASGGGLRVAAGQTSVVGSRFSANHAAQGGAISVGNSNGTTSLWLAESAVFDNQAGGGGGGLSVWGELTARNVTVSGNQATEGAGLHSFGGDLDLAYVTVANNRTFDPNVLTSALLQEVPGASTTWRSSLVVGRCWVGSTVTSSAGGNLEGPGDTCGMGASSDLTGQTAFQLQVLPLAFDGGTYIHPLGAGSNAIGHAGRACPPFDQRHYPRDNGDCDSGAYEWGAEPE